MSTNRPRRGIGELLQSAPKWLLYAILILATSLPLIYAELAGRINVPNRPEPAAQDFYGAIMKVPPGSTILLETDWTNSTRGESGGEFEALLKILMRRGIKLALYSTADPQAPRVAADTIAGLNALRAARGEAPYRRWLDWVNLGYFPNAEGTANALAVNVRRVLAGKKDVNPAGVAADVLTSPVLARISPNVGDLPLLVVITASNTSVIVIERLAGKVPLAFMVTGVMGPETQVYYASGQLVGMVNGLKGVYDMENLMETGFTSSKWGTVPGFPGLDNRGKGSAYYPTLHFALVLLILAVLIGNIGVFLSRWGRRR